MKNMSKKTIKQWKRNINSRFLLGVCIGRGISVMETAEMYRFLKATITAEIPSATTEAVGDVIACYMDMEGLVAYIEMPGPILGFALDIVERFVQTLRNKNPGAEFGYRISELRDYEDIFEK